MNVDVLLAPAFGSRTQCLKRKTPQDTLSANASRLGVRTRYRARQIREGEQAPRPDCCQRGPARLTWSYLQLCPWLRRGSTRSIKMRQRRTAKRATTMGEGAARAPKSMRERRKRRPKGQHTAAPTSLGQGDRPPHRAVTPAHHRPSLHPALPRQLKRPPPPLRPVYDGMDPAERMAAGMLCREPEQTCSSLLPSRESSHECVWESDKGGGVIDSARRSISHPFAHLLAQHLVEITISCAELLDCLVPRATVDANNLTHSTLAVLRHLVDPATREVANANWHAALAGFRLEARDRCLPLRHVCCGLLLVRGRRGKSGARCFANFDQFGPPSMDRRSRNFSESNEGDTKDQRALETGFASQAT